MQERVLVALRELLQDEHDLHDLRLLNKLGAMPASDDLVVR